MSNLAKIKHTIKPRSLTRSIMALFGTDKTVNAHKLYPDKYNKHYYFSKPLCDGIEFVAYYERCSKKRAAELLIQAGFSSYMGEKITEYIEADRLAREHGQKIARNRFVFLLRKYAREKGMDISKFI
jgi:hypothetical protein